MRAGKGVISCNDALEDVARSGLDFVATGFVELVRRSAESLCGWGVRRVVGVYALLFSGPGTADSIRGVGGGGARRWEGGRDSGDRGVGCGGGQAADRDLSFGLRCACESGSDQRSRHAELRGGG